MTAHWRADPPADTDRILADFLADGAPPSEPPLLLPAVLARTALTRRRHAWRVGSWWSDGLLGRRRPLTSERTTMFTAARFLIPVFLVLAGGWYLVATSRAPSQVGGTPSPSPTTSPIALPKPVGGDGATVELEAGTTYVYDDVWGDGSADLILTVPASGWVHNGNAHIAKKPIAGGWFEVLITPWWRPRNLSADPCHSQSGGEVDPPVGPTADDLVTALVAQAAGNAEGPTDVTVGGYPATRLELRIPGGLGNRDIASCEGGQNQKYNRWFDDDDCCLGPYMYPEADGRNIVYILDVGGSRAVIDTLTKWHTSEADLAEAEQLVESMRFEWPTASPSPSAS